MSVKRSETATTELFNGIFGVRPRFSFFCRCNASLLEQCITFGAMRHFWSNASLLEQCIRYTSSSQFNTNKPKKMDFSLRLPEEEGTAITNWAKAATNYLVECEIVATVLGERFHNRAI